MLTCHHCLITHHKRHAHLPPLSYHTPQETCSPATTVLSHTTRDMLTCHHCLITHHKRHAHLPPPLITHHKRHAHLPPLSYHTPQETCSPATTVLSHTTRDMLTCHHCLITHHKRHAHLPPLSYHTPQETCSPATTVFEVDI